MNKIVYNYCLSKLSSLELKDYGHDDNAIDMADQISEIVEKANLEGIDREFELTNEVLFLLENYRFGG